MVSITLDDGNSIQYERFYPVLREFDIDATYYIITSQIGKPGKMTWDELEQLHREGNEIGSHTHTHPRLTTLSSRELELELRKSESLLRPFGCVTLAYPFGEYNDEVVECTKRYYVAARSYCERDVGYNSRLVPERHALKVFPTEFAVPPWTVALLDLPTSAFRKAIEQLVETAVDKHAWIIFVFHGTSDMSPRNVVDSMRTNLAGTISQLRHVRRVVKDLTHYYGRIQTRKLKWMCQYLVDDDRVRVLTVSDVVGSILDQSNARNSDPPGTKPSSG